MRKQLSFMTNTKGFFLPYVLFVTAFVFIIITANINIYTNDIQITHNHLDQLDIETLVQMGRTKFKEELSTIDSEAGTKTYVFPNGNVEITYELFSEMQYDLELTVYTNKDLVYSVKYRAS